MPSAVDRTHPAFLINHLIEPIIQPSIIVDAHHQLILAISIAESQHIPATSIAVASQRSPSQLSVYCVLMMLV